MARILKWKVSEKPTGSYASFHYWSWPTASYPNGDLAAQVTCGEDGDRYDYSSNKREHPPLYLWLADHQEKQWQWRKFKQPLADMKAVKDYAEEMLKKYPQFIPTNPS